MKKNIKNYFVMLFVAILVSIVGKVTAQEYVVGQPVKLGNLEVAQFDYPRALDWWDARDACEALVEGWRLPTETELNILFINRVKIGGFRTKPAADWVQGDYVKDFWSTYWTSFTEGRQFARLQYFSTGKKTLGNAYDKINVRAVRTATKVNTVINLNAQGKVIGKPKKIGNMEVAQFDFPGSLALWEAKRACTLLGGGWRLPTKDELNIIYENKDKLGVFSDLYWSSTQKEGSTLYYWGQNLKTGEQGKWDIMESTVGVRAVRVLN
jgi:hypothetical protein